LFLAFLIFNGNQKIFCVVGYVCGGVSVY
jgi:hypothetical protein